MHFRILLASLLGLCSCAGAPAAEGPGESRYLLFQVWPAMSGYPGIPPLPGRMTLSQEQMAGFVQGLLQAIGTNGDARHKLGFTIGPLCFDLSDDETRQFIREAFTVAKEHDVAVAFHIDDSMSWGNRKDLLANPDNIECADWNLLPCKGRRLDWGPTPTKFPPQMCYNAPAIVTAVKDRAALIGREIKRELAILKSEGKEYLFAAVIAGSETQIGPDYETTRSLGFRALAHRGWSQENPPKDPDAERVAVVKEFIELWANALHGAGVPREKIFCHIVFTSQGLAKRPDASPAEKLRFAPGEVAFSTAYRPGFSTYPEGRTFKEIHDTLAERGSPGWISAEGTNVSPTGMPGEPTMETYLGRMFNHGAVLANIFSWGIGGDAMRENFFRQATENPEALGAYAKFLRSEPLVESRGFSGSELYEKMQRIQTELPSWIHTSGRRAEAMALMRTLQELIQEKNWRRMDEVADQLLRLSPGTPEK